MLNRMNEKDFPLPIFDNEEDEEYITHYTWFLVDDSLSLKKKEEQIAAQISYILSNLAEVNQSSVDTQVKAKLVFFNHEVREYNEVHMDPQRLADTFSAGDYVCRGNTYAGALFRYMDGELTRRNPVIQNLKKNSPGFTFVIVTDAQMNDPGSVRAEGRRVLESNRFYRDYCRVLVVFLGQEKDMATAVALANGDAKNVIALDDNLMPRLLAPLIVDSTVTFADGTHIGNDTARDLTSMAEKTKEREREGSVSADELSDEELTKRLRELMNQ